MRGFPQAEAKGLQNAAAVGPKTRRAGANIRLFTMLVLGLAWFSQAAAAAQNQVDYAGIVIRPDDGTITYAYVPLDAPVSGIELLRKSGVSLVTVGFGGLGEGVCQIEETGCEIGPCRSRLCQSGDRNSPYWRYFQADQDGEWVASPLGGSATKVEPGEVDGWSWTPDQSMLPEVEIGDIPRLAQAENDLDEAHFARYDASGNLVVQAATPGPEPRSFVVVAGVLAGIAIFAFLLRLRPGESA